MDWWRKIRRTWSVLSTRIKLRKSGVRNGGVEYGGDVGLLKLRDDVQMCGYRDVEVMWNMLSITLHHDQVEATNSTPTCCNRKSISTALIINF
ncbi:hypothetical protein HN51_002080 [Arachis hypogaea]|uniref:Uncharacterized protein n=1 Tax=Arachis hypogaea TaxID=3818 RepID=A0A445ENU0_ARAHY|nr:uncharacterized protein LOC114924434 [Arachis hypogaea]QHO50227.1 uncharacterized protein DS421_1g20820 [Arachis hypogaea]RYR77135.1 hypothetical protein Ahy_A01g001601 [Arachis hypogaea]